MARAKKCKKCGDAVVREKNRVESYTILIDRCECGWSLVDVVTDDGESLKKLIDKKVIEKMLKSGKSSIKL